MRHSDVGSVVCLAERLSVELSDITGASVGQVGEIRRRFYTKTVGDLYSEINASKKAYLLCRRLEPQDDAPPKLVRMALCHYLLVKNGMHRKSLTRVLT